MNTNTPKRAASPLVSSREKEPHLDVDGDDIIEFLPLKSIYSPTPPRANSEDEATSVENRRSKIVKLPIGAQNLTPGSRALPSQSQSPNVHTAVASPTMDTQPHAIHTQAAPSAVPAIGPQSHHIVISDDATNGSTSLSSTLMGSLSSMPAAARGGASQRRGRAKRQNLCARPPYGSQPVISAQPPLPLTPSTTQDQILAMLQQKSYQACQTFPRLIDACIHRLEASRMLTKSTHDFYGRSTEYLDAQTTINFRKTIAEQDANVRRLGGDVEGLMRELQAAMAEGLSLALQTNCFLTSKAEESFAQMSARLGPSEQATKRLSAETQALAGKVQELNAARAQDAAKYEESTTALGSRVSLHERMTGELTHGNTALTEKVKHLTTIHADDAAKCNERNAALCVRLHLYEQSIEKLTQGNTALAEKVKELTTICANDALKAAESFAQTSAHLGDLDEATAQATAESQTLKDKVQELSLSNSAQESKIKKLESDRDAMVKRMSKTEEDMAALHKTLDVQKKTLDAQYMALEDLTSRQRSSDAVSSVELEALRKEVEGNWRTINDRQAVTTTDLATLDASIVKFRTTFEQAGLAQAKNLQVIADQLEHIATTASDEYGRCEKLTEEVKEAFKAADEEVMSQHRQLKAVVVDKFSKLEMRIEKLEAGSDKIQNRVTPLEVGRAELQERHLDLKANTEAMQSQLTALDRELRLTTNHGIGTTSSRVINRITNLENDIQALTRDIRHVVKGKRNYDVLDKEIKEIGSITHGLLATTQKLEATHRPKEKYGCTLEQDTAAQAQKLIVQLGQHRDARLHGLESAKHPVLVQLFDIMKNKRDTLNHRVNEIWGTLEGRLEALETVDVTARDQQLRNSQVHVQIVRHALQELDTRFSSLDQPSSGNAELAAAIRPEHGIQLRELQPLLNQHDDMLIALAKLIATCDLIDIVTDMGCYDSRTVAPENKHSNASGDHPADDLGGSYHLRSREKKTTAIGDSTPCSSQPNPSRDALTETTRLGIMQPRKTKATALPTKRLGKTEVSIAACNKKLEEQQDSSPLAIKTELNTRNATTKALYALDKSIAELSGSFEESFVDLDVKIEDGLIQPREFEAEIRERLQKQDRRIEDLETNVNLTVNAAVKKGAEDNESTHEATIRLESDVKAMQKQVSRLNLEVRPPIRHRKTSSTLFERTEELERVVDFMDKDLNRIVPGHKVLDTEMQEMSSIIASLLRSTQNLSKNDLTHDKAVEEACQIAQELREDHNGRLRKLEDVNQDVRLKIIDAAKEKRDVFEKRVTEMCKAMQRRIDDVKKVDTAAKNQQISSFNLIRHALQGLSRALEILKDRKQLHFSMHSVMVLKLLVWFISKATLEVKFTPTQRNMLSALRSSTIRAAP